MVAGAPSSAAPRSDRIILGVRRGVDARSLIHGAGGSVTYRYHAIHAVAAIVPHGALRSLHHLAGVRFAQRDVARHLDGILDPTAPYQGSPEFVPWGVQDVAAADVWDANGNMLIDTGAPAGGGIVVAVIDNGADFGHPDIGSAYDRDLSDCFLSPGCSPTDDITGSFQGHGVAAASVIAAPINDVGVVGVAPRATIVSYRAGDSFLGTLPDSAILAAIDRAIADHVDVISMSFGGPAPSAAERWMLAEAYARGIVLVASSGNGDDHSRGKPPVEFPAKLPSVIAVGATDEDHLLADFSSFGNDQELVAPGVNVPMDGVRGTGLDSGLTIAGTNAPLIDNLPFEFSPVGTVAGRLKAIGVGTTADVAGLDLTGKIALIQRGSITFAEKVANAAGAGASAAIISTTSPGSSRAPWESSGRSRPSRSRPTMAPSCWTNSHRVRSRPPSRSPRPITSTGAAHPSRPRTSPGSRRCCCPSIRRSRPARSAGRWTRAPSISGTRAMTIVTASAWSTRAGLWSR